MNNLNVFDSSIYKIELRYKINKKEVENVKLININMKEGKCSKEIMQLANDLYIDIYELLDCNMDYLYNIRELYRSFYEDMLKIEYINKRVKERIEMKKDEKKKKKNEKEEVFDALCYSIIDIVSIIMLLSIEIKLNVDNDENNLIIIINFRQRQLANADKNKIKCCLEILNNYSNRVSNIQIKYLNSNILK